MGNANTHSRWVNGNLVFYPEGNRQRWLDAFGDNVVKYIDDFAVTPHSTIAANAANNPEWVITHTSGGAMSVVQSADLKGGWLNISPGPNDNDGINMQHRNESFRVEANSDLYFGIRYKADEATRNDFILGLVENDAVTIDGSSHGIFFKTTDGGTYLKCCTMKDGTTTKTLTATSSFAADTVYVDEFLVKSTGSVEFWHNGSTVGKYTTNIPSTDLAVTIAYETGAANSSQDLYVDYIRCIQLFNARAT